MCEELDRVLSLYFVAALGSAKAQHDVADVVLVNANVFTAVDAHPHAEAIAIKGDRILAVDTNQTISSFVGCRSREQVERWGKDCVRSERAERSLIVLIYQFCGTLFTRQSDHS
jgi:hypothetical protein